MNKSFLFIISRTDKGRQDISDALMKGVTSGYVIMKIDMFEDLLHHRLTGDPVYPREVEGAELKLTDLDPKVVS